MRRVLRGFATAFLVMMWHVMPAAAQPAAARVTNPGTLEFQVPDSGPQPVSTYRIELFVSGADVAIAAPTKIVDVTAGPVDPGQPLRIDFRNILEGISNGEYIATIRAVRGGNLSARSEPTAPFAVSGRGTFNSTPPPDERPLTAEEQRHERFWTKIAIIIGGAAVLVPFLVQ